MTHTIQSPPKPLACVGSERGRHLTGCEQEERTSWMQMNKLFKILENQKVLFEPKEDGCQEDTTERRGWDSLVQGPTCR